jgi:glutamate-1-semialdehyde 2,1-aminomutase
MFGFYFSDKLPQNLKEVKLANEEHFNKFFHMMLDAGVYFAPSMYEAGFVCIAHSNKIIEQTLDAAKKVFAKL